MIEFHIRMAVLDDVAVMDSIMHTARDAMEDPGLYVADNREFIRRHIDECGFALIACVQNIAAGFLIVRIPGLEEDNLGRDLGFDEAKLLLSAHMESAAVLPEFQGNRLQTKLIAGAEQILALRGFRYALGTVSPKNVYSLTNMRSLGYQIMQTTLKYGGLERHIIMKQIVSP